MTVSVIDYQSHTAPTDFTSSLHKTGFAVLTNHPISHGMLAGIYDEWSTFFDSDAKYRYRFSRDAQDGYFPRPRQVTATRSGPARDDKEFFHVFPWGRYPEEVTDAAVQYRRLAMDLAASLLNWLQQCTPPTVLARVGSPLVSTLVGGEKNTLLRILKYPAVTTDGSSAYPLRAGPHKDTNLITLLACATHPGLQVLTRTGKWFDVPWDFGSVVVNSGVMLDLLTEGYFPAVAHRVALPKESASREARLSMPLFLHPADNVAIDGDVTAATFLRQRLETSYGPAGKSTEIDS